MKYDVYLHNVPKVNEDGTKSLPIAPFQTKEFTDLEEARKFAGEQKDKFDRVVIVRLKEEKQWMVERYMDGEHIVNDKPDPADAQPADAQPAEDAPAEDAPADEAAAAN